MSDTADDIDFDGRQLLNKSRLVPLRERMEAFVDEYEAANLRELRSSVADGKPLSDVVIDDRDERV